MTLSGTNLSPHLAAWLFPDFRQVHIDWFAQWFGTRAFAHRIRAGRPVLAAQISPHIRNHCGPPALPQDELARNVCALDNQNRLALGESLVYLLVADSVRKSIDGKWVHEVQSQLGHSRYLSLIQSQVKNPLSHKQTDLLVQSFVAAVKKKQLACWSTRAAIQVLECLLGEDTKFNSQRLILQVSPRLLNKTLPAIQWHQEHLSQLCTDYWSAGAAINVKDSHG